MSLSRREFLQMLAVASAAGFKLTGCDASTDSPADATATSGPADPYELRPPSAMFR